MSKLSKNQIQERRKRLQAEALNYVAKTEQLNIRMDENSIRRLYKLAAKNGKPVGTMVREWILERIKIEELPARANNSMDALVDLVVSLHSKIDKAQIIHHSSSRDRS